MLVTFLALIVPFLVLVRPLQRNAYFVLYFALMVLSAYVTETYYFRVQMFSYKAFLLFAVYRFYRIRCR